MELDYKPSIELFNERFAEFLGAHAGLLYILMAIPLVFGVVFKLVRQSANAAVEVIDAPDEDADPFGDIADEEADEEERNYWRQARENGFSDEDLEYMGGMRNAGTNLVRELDEWILDEDDDD